MGGRIALLAASIVLVLAVLELGCRLERGRYYLLHWPNLVLDSREGAARYLDQAMVHDDELGYRPRPNHVHRDAAHDDEGLRRTPSPAGLAPRPLLLAMGDSFTYGAEVGDADTWPSRLQGLLGVRVLNGGVPAYGLDQAVLRSERLARKFQPQALILGFITDDLRRNELRRFVGFNKPLLIQAGDDLTPAGPVPPPQPARQSLAPWDHLFGWSVLFNIVLHRLDWLEDWPADSVRVLPSGAGERMACPLMRRLEALGVPVLVVAQYAPDAWDDDRIAGEQRRQALVVLGCAALAGLATLDTYAALDQRGARHLFMPEGHLTAEGNALTATAIAAALKRLGLPLQ
jgi:hypothetical protein